MRVALWKAGAVALALSGTGGAADLSGTVWKYVQGQAAQAPTFEGRQGPFFMRNWERPAGLQAQGAGFSFLPELGTDYWMFMLLAPRLPTAQYLGTTRLQPLGRAGKGGVLNVSLIGGGPFKGLLVMEGTVTQKDGTRLRLVTLLTKQFATTDPATERYGR